MSETFISDRPPHDGREYECQCARCGSSCDWTDCYDCDDGYCGSDCIDDLCHGGECIHGDSGQIVCHICDGYGGWYTCLSGDEWCKANPMDGRENVDRGKIEWFVVKEPRHA